MIAVALHVDANDLDGRRRRTHFHSYSNEGEVKMTKEIISMLERAGFEAVERDTVYNRGGSVSCFPLCVE